MRPALDHDALFKLLLTTLFHQFIECSSPELAAELLPGRLTFLDKESFVDLLDPDRREADMLVQILDFRYQVVQLNQLNWRNYFETTNPVVAALMARMRIERGDRWRVKAACLRLMAGLPLNGQQRRMIGQFVDLYLPLRPPETRLLQRELAMLSKSEQEVLMEVMTSWEITGHAKGRAEGRAEG